MAEFDQMPAENEPAADIVDSHQIELAALRIGRDVMVQEDHRNSRVAQPFDHAAIGIQAIFR